jgi:hypothetical protein
MTETKRPYYDKQANQRAIAASEKVAKAAIDAFKKSLGFGVVIIIGTDGKKYKTPTHTQ